MSRQQPLIMVCVTQQLSCERLVYFGEKLAAHRGGRLMVVSVKPSREARSPEVGETLEHLFSLAKHAAAELDVLYHDFPAEAIAELARERGVDCVVAGVSPDNGLGSFHEQLSSGLLHASLLVIDDGGNLVDRDKKESGTVFRPLAITV